MPVDVGAWRTVVEQVVGWIANEEGQRRAWFGRGPDVSSPDDDFCAFFGDAAIPEFLDRIDARLSPRQMEAGRQLVSLMRELSDATPQHIDPESLIDDPRWQQIRAAAARFSAELSERC